MLGTIKSPAIAAPMLAGVGAAACAYIAVVDPAQPGNYPTCPFFALTGRYCPGCGTLRALHFLLRGEFIQAIDSNVLAVALLPYLAWSSLAWSGIRLGEPIARMVNARAGAARLLLVGSIIAFGVLRNLPWMPLELLAP